MVGKVRDALNEAPPWASYSIVGVGLVIVVGLIVWQLKPGGSGQAGDKNFYCPDCETGFTKTAEEAREMLREAAKANPGKRALAKCPKCSKYTCITGLKCAKCGAYFEMAEGSTSLFPTSWRDECPECGYSAQKEEAVQAAMKQKAEGTYDPDKLLPFIVEAVEEAEAKAGGGKK